MADNTPFLMYKGRPLVRSGNVLYYAAGIALAFAFKDNRAFCKYLCPVTVFLKPMSYFSLMRISCDSTKCISCGTCEKACVGALQICGTQMSVQEVITQVLKDKIFYKNSGGGMTLSGGEPFMQHKFALELLRAAKELGSNVSWATSLPGKYAPRSAGDIIAACVMRIIEEADL